MDPNFRALNDGKDTRNVHVMYNVHEVKETQKAIQHNTMQLAQDKTSYSQGELEHATF